MSTFPSLNASVPYNAIAHSGAGALAINITTAQMSVITLTANITTLSFTGWPPSTWLGTHIIKFIQGGGGGFTVGWDAALQWAGGTVPTITATAGAVDVLVFQTTDGGTTVLGFVSGQDFQ